MMRLVTSENIYISIAILMLTFGISNFFQYKRLAKCKDAKWNFFMWLISFLTLPYIGMLSYLIFGVYKIIVGVILRIRFGNKYGGIVTGQDAMFLLDYPKQVTLTVILTVQSDKSPEDFYQTARNTVINEVKTKLKHCKKVCGILKCFMGYAFIVRDQIEVEECVKELQHTIAFPNTMSKADLLRLNEEHLLDDLPKNNAGFWDISIGKQQVMWRDSEEEEEKKLYPILLRFSHSMSDGVHMFTAILALFGDVANVQQERQKDEKHFDIFKKLYLIVAILIDMMNQLLYFFKYVPVVLVTFDILTRCSNSLFGVKLSNKLHMCINEKASNKYLNMAKDIKKRLSNVALTDIFAGVFAASLTDYFEKYDSQIPINLTAACTASPGATSLISLNPNELQNRRIACINRVHVYMLNLPTLSRSGAKEKGLLQLLENISEQRSHISSSHEAPIYYWIFNVLSRNYPLKFIKFITYQCGVTSIVTNIPGSKAINVMNGSVLKNILCFSPNRDRTGVGLAIITYDGKLYFTLTIDTTLIQDRSRVQEILDGIYSNLEMLDRATK